MKYPAQGCLYIVRFQNSVIKVGMTVSPPKFRLADYERQAKVHDNPIVEHFNSCMIDDVYPAESALIEWMRNHGEGLSKNNKRPEWFRVEPGECDAVYGRAIEQIMSLTTENSTL